MEMRQHVLHLLVKTFQVGGTNHTEEVVVWSMVIGKVAWSKMAWAEMVHEMVVWKVSRPVEVVVWKVVEMVHVVLKMDHRGLQVTCFYLVSLMQGPQTLP